MEAEQLEATLKRIADAVDDLQRAGREKEAIELAMQRVDLVRRYHGERSLAYHSGKTAIAQMLLRTADVLLAEGDLRQVCDLAQHVNTLTKDVSSDPTADFRRKLARSGMHKALLQARHRQGSHRSAVSFARKIVAEAEQIHLLTELPTARLNLAAALSAEGQHTEALGLSYAAYQTVATLVCAMDASVDPQNDDVRYVRACVRLQQAAADGNDDAVRAVLDQCEYLSGVVGPIEQSTLAHQAAEENLHDLMARPSVSPDVRLRWGGILALAYRSIACEQEHLGQQGAALLTYRVSVSTAENCLGPDHLVTLQCKNALDATREAQASTRPKSATLRGLPGKSFCRFGKADRVPGASGMPVLSTVKTGDHAGSGATESSQAANVSRAHGRQQSVHGVRRRTPSPALQAKAVWNQWFSSSQPPPLSMLATQVALPRAFIPRRGDVDSDSAAATHSHPTPTSAAASPIGAAGAVSDEPYSTGAPVNHPSSNAEVTRDRPTSDAPRPLSAHDKAFLQQTYRLRRDPLSTTLACVERPKPPRPSSAVRRTDGVSADSDRYYRLLDDHRRYADEMARELGM
jgi:hypothetical protein